MKTALRLSIGILLSGVFLWLAFRNVALEEMWGEMRAIDPLYIGVYVLTLIVIQFCRIFRWGVLVRPFATISTRALIRISSIGLMLVLVMPLRLGEFARPYLLKRETGARMSSGLGSVVVERSIDGLLVTGLFFVTTFMLEARHEVPAVLVVAGRVALVFFAAVTAVSIATLVARDRVLGLLRRIGTPISARLTEKAVGMLGAFADGLRSLPDFGALAVFIGLTLIYWAANGFGMWLLMRGFGWETPMLAGFVLVCVLVIGIMVPAGPGFLGTFQAAVAAGLSIFGVSASAAGAYNMVLYPLNVAVVCGFGIPFLLGRGGQVSEIVHASEEIDAEEPAA
jgi:uncharacterized protein (TIRG00374 family)